MPEYSVHPLELRMHERRQKSVHLSHIEIVEAVRLAISAEMDLLGLYEQVANITRDDTVKRVFGELARERQKVIGMLFALLSKLDAGFGKRFREGVERFNKEVGGAEI